MIFLQKIFKYGQNVIFYVFYHFIFIKINKIIFFNIRNCCIQTIVREMLCGSGKINSYRHFSLLNEFLLYFINVYNKKIFKKLRFFYCKGSK